MIISLIILILVLIIIYLLLTNRTPVDKQEAIKIMVRQSARWSNAAQQDKSPLISVLHANYGAGYLWALRDIATDQEIESITGVNVHELMMKILSIQDESTKRVIEDCPQYANYLDPFLMKIGIGQ